MIDGFNNSRGNTSMDDLIKAMKEMAESANATAKSISEAELAVRDRVDISRKEYDEMTRKLEKQESEIFRMKEILQGFKLPPDVPICPDSVEFAEEYDPWNRKRWYRFTFAVNEFDIARYGGRLE